MSLGMCRRAYELVTATQLSESECLLYPIKDFWSSFWKLIKTTSVCLTIFRKFFWTFSNICRKSSILTQFPKSLCLYPTVIVQSDHACWDLQFLDMLRKDFVQFVLCVSDCLTYSSTDPRKSWCIQRIKTQFCYKGLLTAYFKCIVLGAVLRHWLFPNRTLMVDQDLI